MKIKTLFVSMLAVAGLAIGCTDDDNDSGTGPTVGDDSMAYMSVKVATPYLRSDTRAEGSEEKEAASKDENAIKSLWVVLFDTDNQIVAYSDPGGTPDAAAKELTSEMTPVGDGEVEFATGAFRISSKAEKIMIVANPGTALKARLTGATVGETYDALNEALVASGADQADWLTVGEVTDATNGFTMINSDELVKVNKYVVGSQYKDATAAKAAAETAGNETKVTIERLTSKVKLTTDPDLASSNKDDVFKFTGWILDNENGNLIPLPEKTWLDDFDAPTSDQGQTVYKKNFYVVDPNYLRTADNASSENVQWIRYNTKEANVNANYKNSGDEVYCIENTMDEHGQQYQAATRVVIKGVYTPKGVTAGKDWFKFGTTTYNDFASLQDAVATTTTKALKDAAASFYTHVKEAIEADGATLTATDFSQLKQEDLDQVKFGGDVVKEANCIQWYQGGVCYYFYEIVHNNYLADVTGNPYSKYGVVRNNFYVLNFKSVKQAGTPWYPNTDPNDPNGPDPTGPNGADDIDESEAYANVEVTIAPFVVWTNELNL